jgi:hypothetical protein
LLQLSPAALDFGGSNVYSGVSTSRTLMLRELTDLLAVVPFTAEPTEYRRAIVDDNVLLKPSAGTRAKTYSFLRGRFALDPAVPAFSLLRFLWAHDAASQPLLALMVALLRDAFLRSTVAFLEEATLGQVVRSPDFAQVIQAELPELLGEKTLKSTSENITSTYRQSGHLECGRVCVRTRVEPTPASVTMALLFATLDGNTGQALFESEWVRLLDAAPESIMAEARIASARGWLELRAAGDVIDISFRRLLETIGAPA